MTETQSLDDLCRQLEIEMTPEQRRACWYLHRQGFKFLVDFGCGNAIEIAKEQRRKEAERGGPFIIHCTRKGCQHKSSARAKGRAFAYLRAHLRAAHQERKES